jgi:hypothetical protein
VRGLQFHSIETTIAVDAAGNLCARTHMGNEKKQHACFGTDVGLREGHLDWELLTESVVPPDHAASQLSEVTGGHSDSHGADIGLHPQPYRPGRFKISRYSEESARCKPQRK